ncbi:unnamed protein product, partial [Acanthoscelides obtectus]
ETKNEPPLICAAGEGESAEPSTHATSKKYKRQTDMCYFCETVVQSFVRHLRRNHLCETKVQEIFSHQKNSVERRKLLELLKKKGNYIKKSEECVKRKRPGELQRVFLRNYESSEIKTGAYEDFEEIITQAEKLRIKNLKRVVIRGKRGRGVPVLFSNDIQRHVKELLKVRNNFVPKENPYFFGKPGLNGPIQGYKVIAKYAHACGPKNPHAITCTRLRKHLATLSQLFSLTENEIEQLSNFMGNTPGVHKNAYRLPDDLYQTPKISKLVILMEKGQAGGNKGNGLRGITVDLEGDLLEENGCDDGDGENMENEEDDQEEKEIKEKLSNKTVVSEQKGKKEELPVAVNKKKRIRTPWSSEQKEAVTFFFNKNIKMKKALKRKDCEEIKKEYNPYIINGKKKKGGKPSKQRRNDNFVRRKAEEADEIIMAGIFKRLKISDPTAVSDLPLARDMHPATVPVAFHCVPEYVDRVNLAAKVT